MIYDWTLILLLPAILLSGWAQAMVKSAYSKYKQIPNSRGITGAQAARQLLDSHGLSNIRIEQGQGTLTDHFDPRAEVIRLSPEVYDGASVSAVSIAAHETGHAMQYGDNYGPLKIRNALVLPVNLVSRASWLILIIGCALVAAGNMATGNILLNIGVFCFLGVVVFHGITLPVELNASRRAVNTLLAEGIIAPEEKASSWKVLRAAAMTYLAALIVAVVQLLRVLIIIRGRNR